MTFMPLQPGQEPPWQAVRSASRPSPLPDMPYLGGRSQLNTASFNPQQMLAMLGNHSGLGAGPMGPMSAPPIPGVVPPGGQGVSTPGMLPQQILSLMAQPKLQGKVR